MSNKDRTIFRIRFYNEDDIYEIYANSIAQEAIFGFLEVEQIVFGEHSATVIDPAEERLKQEFQDVICSYIPIQSIIRIDEVKKQGVAKVIQTNGASHSNIVRPFPSLGKTPGSKK